MGADRLEPQAFVDERNLGCTGQPVPKAGRPIPGSFPGPLPPLSRSTWGKHEKNPPNLKERIDFLAAYVHKLHPLRIQGANTVLPVHRFLHDLGFTFTNLRRFEILWKKLSWDQRGTFLSLWQQSSKDTASSLSRPFPSR